MYFDMLSPTKSPISYLGDSCQEIILVAFNNYLSHKAVLSGFLSKSMLVDVKPRERLADGVFVLEVKNLLAIISGSRIVETPFLVLEQIADVGGVAEQLTTRCKDEAKMSEENREAFQRAYNTNAVHQHEYGVVCALML